MGKDLYEIGASAEARYDPSTSTYITVLDPVAVNTRSSLQLYEWITHELVHHITYNPATGHGTENHGRGFWDKHDTIKAGSRSCRS